MGIVAFCPRGHRVKVKDSLAGRRGICPRCGERFRIPEQSTPPSPPASRHERPPAPGTLPARRTQQSPAGSSDGPPVARIVSFDPELAASLPRALPLARPPDATR